MQHAGRAALALVCLLALVGCANTPGRRGGLLLAGDPLATPTPFSDAAGSGSRIGDGTDQGAAYSSNHGGADTTGSGSASSGSRADSTTGLRSPSSGAGGTSASAAPDSPAVGSSEQEDGSPALEDDTTAPAPGSAPHYGEGAGTDADEGLIRCGGTFASDASAFGMVFGYSMPTDTYDDPYSVSIDYDDGMRANAVSSDFDQIFRHLYASPGTYVVTATISGGSIAPQTDSCTFTWTHTGTAAPASPTPRAPGEDGSA